MVLGWFGCMSGQEGGGECDIYARAVRYIVKIASDGLIVCFDVVCERCTVLGEIRMFW